MKTKIHFGSPVQITKKNEKLNIIAEKKYLMLFSKQITLRAHSRAIVLDCDKLQVLYINSKYIRNIEGMYIKKLIFKKNHER